MNIEETLLEIKEDLGFIKSEVKFIKEKVNGTIEKMEEHIKDGVHYRQCVEKNSAYRKAFIWAFVVGLVLTTLGSVVFAIARQVLK